MGLGMIGESSPLIIKSKRVRVRGLTGVSSLTLPRCGNADAKGTSNGFQRNSPTPGKAELQV